MNAIFLPVVGYPMRKADVDVIAVPFFELQPVPVDAELDAGVRLNGDMDSHLTILEAEKGIGVLPDDGSRCQAQEAHGFQRTGKGGEHLLKVSAAAQRFGIEVSVRSGLLRVQLPRVPVERTECDAVPVSAVITFVVMRSPFMRVNAREVRFERLRIELKREPQAGDHCAGRSMKWCTPSSPVRRNPKRA